MKDLFPPTPQQRTAVALVIPRAAYYFHLTATVVAMLLVALHLGRASHSVNLAWDANSEPDIAEYKVYWGLESGAPNQSRKVGNVTTATVDNLDDGTTYFFTVTAFKELVWKATVQRGFLRDAFSQQRYTLTVIREAAAAAHIFLPFRCLCMPIRQIEEKNLPIGMVIWQILQLPRNNKDNEAYTIERDVTITAVYSALPSFMVTVTNGSGDGNYYAGETVGIAANVTSSQQFVRWTGNALFADASSSTTTFTMPAADVFVTAIYSSPEYPLAVTNGSGAEAIWPIRR